MFEWEKKYTSMMDLRQKEQASTATFDANMLSLVNVTQKLPIEIRKLVPEQRCRRKLPGLD